MTPIFSDCRRVLRSPFACALTAAALLAGAGPAVASGVAPGTIDTYAGGGLGLGGQAASAPLWMQNNALNGMAQDRQGNLYVTSLVEGTVERVAPNGTMEIVAGVPCPRSNTGCSAVSGDGGPALSAHLDQPTGVAVDSAGTIYVAEASDVRRIDTGGTITTYAGDPSCTASLLVDDEPATAACLFGPTALAFDRTGRLLISATGNNEVVAVDTAPQVDGVRHLHIVAGGGTCSVTDPSYFLSGNGLNGGACGDGGPATSAGLALPAGIALDSAGDMYIADTGHNAIRVVDSGGIIHTFAGQGAIGYSGDGGPAASAELSGPLGVAVSATAVYIADTGNHRVRRVAFADHRIVTAVGNELAGFSGDGLSPYDTSLFYPTDVMADGRGGLYIADAGNLRIRYLDPHASMVTTVAGDGSTCATADRQPARRVSFCGPVGAAVDPGGNLLVADGNAVRRVDRAGTVTLVAGSDRPLTASHGASQLCQALGDGGVATSANLCNPSGVAVDAAGDLYIVDAGNDRIRRVDARTGIISTIAGTGVAGFSGDGGPAVNARLNLGTPYHNVVGVAVDRAGTVYVSDQRNDLVRSISHGVIQTVAGGGTTGPSTVTASAATSVRIVPYGLVVGPDGALYISDEGAGLVYKVAGGVLSVVAGGSPVPTTATPGPVGDGGPATQAVLNQPAGLSFDGAGNLYIAEMSGRVRRVDGSGTITTVAGFGGTVDTGNPAGRPQFCGDGGSATAACLSQPTAVAVDHSSLYIADAGNQRIRIVGLDPESGHRAGARLRPTVRW